VRWHCQVFNAWGKIKQRPMGSFHTARLAKSPPAAPRRSLLQIGRSGVKRWTETWQITRSTRAIWDSWGPSLSDFREDGAVNKFRGFFGDYDVLIETATGPYPAQLKLSKGVINQFTFKLGSPRL
jgi:hypothetical protein